MSDETEMNPELENFAAKLQNVPAPEAKLDRDQLMYDAGWAAALSNQTPKATVRGRGFSSLAMSFAGGIAVAAAVLLSIVPLAQDVDAPTIGHDGVALMDVKQTVEFAGPTSHAASSDAKETDLLAWIENLPPGESISSGFSSRPTNPALANLDSSSQRLANQRPYKPKTSGQLLSELMPDVATRPATPAWSAWLMP